jgi:hypothetical protein
MKVTSMISNAWKSQYLSSTAARLAMAFVCCIPSVSAQQKTSGAVPDLKTQTIALLELKPLAKAMNSAIPGNNQPTATSPQNQSLGSGTKEQYIALYNALKKLETTRSQYLETLDLYVAAVTNHLSMEIRDKRLDAFRDSLTGLRTDLQTLNDAFAPLQLRLEYENPDLSDRIDQYISTRQAKAAAGSVIDTLSISDLKNLSAQEQPMAS